LLVTYATQLMPAAHQQPLLLATCAFDLATQLMPAAHKQPLLLAVQRKGKRGGKSATQLMPAAHPPAKYLCLLLATFAFVLRNAKAKVQRKGNRGGKRGGKSASIFFPSHI
jgi:hypothetical protein